MISGQAAEADQAVKLDLVDLHHESLSNNMDRESRKAEAGLVAPKNIVAPKGIVVPKDMVVQAVPKDQEALVASVRRLDPVWCYLI